MTYPKSDVKEMKNLCLNTQTERCSTGKDACLIEYMKTYGMYACKQEF